MRRQQPTCDANDEEKTNEEKSNKQQQPAKCYVHLNWINMSSVIARPMCGSSFLRSLICSFRLLCMNFFLSLLSFRSHLWMFKNQESPGRFESSVFVFFCVCSFCRCCWYRASRTDIKWVYRMMCLRYAQIRAVYFCVYVCMCFERQFAFFPPNRHSHTVTIAQKLISYEQVL